VIARVVLSADPSVNAGIHEKRSELRREE